MGEIYYKSEDGKLTATVVHDPFEMTAGMTENAFRTIREILLAGDYYIDELDLVEIVMEYERKTGAHIPDHWLRG